MDVAATTGLFGGRLGHERHADAKGIGQFLEAVLHDRVPVGHFEDCGVADVQFVLAPPPLPFRTLDRNPATGQSAAGFTHVALDAGPLQEVVVLDVPTSGLQTAVTLGLGVPVGVVEKEELQLRGTHGGVAGRAAARHLTGEHRARCDFDRFGRLPSGDVGEDDHTAVGPRRPAQRRDVGDHVEVAVAALPVGEAVARHGIHLHVDGQQVVTCVGAVVQALLQEEPGVESLAQQPPVTVGEGDDHRVDLTGVDQRAESFWIHRASNLPVGWP